MMNDYQLINVEQLKRFRMDHPHLDDVDLMAQLNVELARQLHRMDTQRCMAMAKSVDPLLCFTSLHPTHEQIRNALQKLLADTKTQMAPQQDTPPAANNQKPKKKSKPGPAVTQLFTDEKHRQKTAAWIHDLYTTYYDKQQKIFIVAEDSYNLTDFLLAIYYVLVERKVTISVIGNNVNSQYYKFLTEECQLEGLASQKTFLEHLNKLVKTGKNFYQLTKEVIAKNATTGGYTKEEYERMKTMTATVKQLLPGEIVNQGEMSK